VINRRAYDLFHKGSIALARIEHNGIAVDKDYLNSAIPEVDAKIRTKEALLRDSKVYKVWRDRFGTDSTLGSTQQLGEVFFKKLGYKPLYKTTTGQYEATERAFAHVDDPFLKDYFAWKKLNKAKSTYLHGIQRELVNGRIHPDYLLTQVATHRSSCTSPNFQNMPIRNPDIGAIIRKCFTATPGWHLVEIDYGQIEVMVAQCYHGDPTMYKYITDKTKDMHRDMAFQCYMLDAKTYDPKGKTRYASKNKFVFPQFYGSFYVDCARALWDAIDELNLKTLAGVPLKEHLRSKGIYSLGKCDPAFKPQPGTFEYHLREVETDFWGKRFPVYTQWKEAFYKQYLKTLKIEYLTGFIVEGVFAKNQVLNFAIQGSSFHCLLLSLILLQGRIDREGKKTKIVGEIHDSMLLDSPPDEVQWAIENATDIMTREVAELWDWIVVPLKAEVDVVPVRKSWYGKEEWVKKNGLWGRKTA
jgi:DNA polymerase-1